MPCCSHTRPRRIPLDPDIHRVALVLGVVTAVTFCLAIAWLWVPLLIVLLTLLMFFRDPPRRVPDRPGAVVSPADGKVVSIHTNEDPEAGPVGGPCVAIFLSVLNVHVNRAPYDGRVDLIQHRPGLFLNAMNPESGRRNESNWVFMDCGPCKMTVRLIAGLIARRIVCRVEEGQQLRRGQRIGLIRFGSRAELYLPPEAHLDVRVGDRVKGGESVIAHLPHEEAEA